MTKETMTVHEALAELKTLDKRIDKKLQTEIFVDTYRVGTDKIRMMSIEGFREITRDNFNSIRDLIKRRNALKRAVVLSNATTSVEVGGVEYTVAEAIDMKNHGMTKLNELLSMLTLEYNNAINTCKIENENLISRATHSLQQLSGGDTSLGAEDIQKYIDDFVKNQRMEVATGIDCQKVIAELENEVSTFNTKIDSALSVSNAITTIEFEY